MNLGEINEELDSIVDDPHLATQFTSMVNIAVYEIAHDFDLPALRVNEPVELVTTENNWLYDMPTAYMKKLFKCRDENWTEVNVERDMDDIDLLDIDHDTTGANVTNVATRDLKLGIYPKAADTLKLWFYEKPTTLVEQDDIPVCIPEQFHYRVIIPKVVVRNFTKLMDMTVNPPAKSLEWWKAAYHAGIYGDGADIGLIHAIAREKKPKRHGGADPLP